MKTTLVLLLLVMGVLALRRWLRKRHLRAVHRARSIILTFLKDAGCEKAHEYFVEIWELVSKNGIEANELSIPNLDCIGDYAIASHRRYVAAIRAQHRLLEKFVQGDKSRQRYLPCVFMHDDVDLKAELARYKSTLVRLCRQHEELIECTRTTLQKN